MNGGRRRDRSVLLLGSPGAGTSRLAHCLITILPAMTLAEALETTCIHRVAGLTGARTALVTARPCRTPHHTISDVGRIGGGHIPTPGEVSRAHHGILFLDERRSSGGMSWRSCAKRWRMVLYTYNLAGVLDFARLAALAACVARP